MLFKANEENVRILGRTITKQDVLYLNYSCSAIEFEFTGTKVEAILWTDGAKEETEFPAYVAVFINEEEVPSKRIELKETEANYILFESETTVTATLRLMKMSEATFAKVGIKGIIVDSDYKVNKTKEKDKKIEFIGDSITCGYGNEGQNNVDTFHTATENPWETYAAKTARYFDADFNLISWSGIGVISSYTEEEKPNDEWLMPMLYAYTDLGLEKTLLHSEYEIWDSNRFQPDVIVINLGTNDTSYTKNIKQRIDLFGQSYYEFLKQVRNSNKDSEIICTLGVMGDELYKEIEKQVERYQEENLDYKVHAMAFDVQKEEDGIGIDDHPSIITHDKMANKLIQKIRDIMKW